MVNNLQSAFNEIAELRGLPEDVVQEALQSALVSAYRRYSSASSAQNIEARTDPHTRRLRIYVEKEVSEDVVSPNTEVTLEQARFYEPEAQIGDMVMVQVDDTAKKFGRIAAQTAKQVILQKIREAERNALYDEFADKEGELMMGTVQSLNASVVTLRLSDRAEAILPRAQQIPGERYRPHEKLRVYIMEVRRSSKGPQIVTSRSHRNMLRRLLEYEVPEIYNGQVEIKSIAREAGYRSKVAVAALQEGIDPVGACVGMRGIRIQNIVKELHDEKIDVIEWNPDPEVFISKALSPARVTGVYLDDDEFEGRTAVVVVPDDQLSLAIGREGQNARLAAKLTGWRIDIKSASETAIGALENLDVPPLDALVTSHAQLIEDVRAIIDKKQANKAIMPEDLNLLGKFANLVETRLQRMREDIRREEQEEIDVIRATLPEALFDVPVDALGLRDEITDALQSFDTAGDVMLATLADEERLNKALARVDGDALTEIQTALDELMTLDLDTLAEDEIDTDETAGDDAETVAEADIVPDTPTVAEAEPESAPSADLAPADDIAEAEPASVTDDLAEEIVTEPEQPAEAIADTSDDDTDSDADADEAIDYDKWLDLDEKFDSEDDSDEQPDDRRKRRRLVFDEESGEVVAKNRRKRDRRPSNWEEDYDL